MAEKRSKRERKVRSNTVSCVIEIFTAFGEKIVIELFAALATAHTKAFMKTMCLKSLGKVTSLHLLVLIQRNQASILVLESRFERPVLNL